MEIILETFILVLMKNGTWKKFDQLKNIYQKYYSSNYYDAKLNKYQVKTGASLRS